MNVARLAVTAGVLISFWFLLPLTHAQAIRSRLVSDQVIHNRLEKYAGKDSQRAETLKAMFREAGCDGEHLSEQPVKGSKLPNIVCVLPGSGERTIVVGAHYDHVSDGDGVVDNWSGASLLPSLYEAVKVDPRQHTFIFVGFTDEEKGEIGSHFYVKEMTKEQVATTDAMVNFDTLGLAPTEVWASHSDKRLTNVLFNLADRLKVPVTAVNVEQVGSTDSEQFAQRKIASITIHSLTQQSFNAGVLHTANDRISAIHFDEYYQTYRLVAMYLALLDTALPPATPTTH